MEPIRILFFSQYFPPEMGAPAARVYELCRRWAGWGHEVSVLTAFPHHPIGQLYPGYRVRWFDTEQVERIQVYRSWVLIAANRGFLKRVVSYFSYAFSAIINAFRVRRPQVIIATSPQFLCAIAGYLVSWLRKVPFVLEIRDIWPESIVAVGAMKEGFAIGVLRKIEQFLYRHAHHIVVVTQAFRRYMLEHGVPDSKISVITNGVDDRLFRPLASTVFPSELGQKNGRLVVTYVGTHGMAHGLSTILNVADSFRDEVLFVFIGEGAEKACLKERKEQARLDNVLFIDRVAREEVPRWVTASDLCLVHLKKTPLFETVIPSKIFEFMGCGKPLLMGVLGEARQIVEEADAALYFEPEDEASLKKALRQALTDRQRLLQLGQNGLSYVAEHYQIDKLARRYETVISKVCHGEG